MTCNVIDIIKTYIRNYIHVNKKVCSYVFKSKKLKEFPRQFSNHKFLVGNQIQIIFTSKCRRTTHPRVAIKTVYLPNVCFSFVFFKGGKHILEIGYSLHSNTPKHMALQCSLWNMPLSNAMFLCLQNILWQNKMFVFPSL